MLGGYLRWTNFGRDGRSGQEVNIIRFLVFVHLRFNTQSFPFFGVYTYTSWAAESRTDKPMAL